MKDIHVTDRKIEDILAHAQEIRMTQEEKSAVLSRALASIEKIESVHALNMEEATAVTGAAAGKGSIKTTFFSAWNSYVSTKKFVPALTVMALCLLTGGASIEAEKSLPGDSLYPIKVDLNEQVANLAAVTPQEKAQAALDAANQRLIEAAILSSRGELTAENNSIIQEQLSKQAGEVHNQVEALVATNDPQAAQEIAVSFESNLKAQELILEKISTDQASSSLLMASSTASSTPDSNISHILDLLSAVRDTLATTTSARVSLQAREVYADGGDRSKVEARYSDLLSGITTEQQTLDDALQNGSGLSVSTASTSAAYIAEATKLSLDAKNMLDVGLNASALVSVQQAEQLLTNADSLIAADINASAELKSVVNAAFSNVPITVGQDTSAEVKDIDTLQQDGDATSTATSTISSNSNATSTDSGLTGAGSSGLNATSTGTSASSSFSVTI